MLLFGIRRDSSRDEAHACAARPTTTPDVASSTSSRPPRPSPFHPALPLSSPTILSPRNIGAVLLLLPPASSSYPPYRLRTDNSDDDDDDVPISLQRILPARCSSGKAIEKMDRKKEAGVESSGGKERNRVYPFQDNALTIHLLTMSLSL